MYEDSTFMTKLPSKCSTSEVELIPLIVRELTHDVQRGDTNTVLSHI